jgi:hypothetical protein
VSATGDDEAAQREAERLAAGLHRLGWEVGAGATIWARAIQDVLALHDSARDRFAANTVDLETWERLHSTALVLVVAIDQVLAFERRVRRLTGDAELARARERFDRMCPDAAELRHLVAHLDAYAVGEGWRQTGHRLPPIEDTNLETFVFWTNGGGTNLKLSDHHIDLRRAARAATELAEVVERVRARHLARVEREANEAFRRRYGLPPD